MHRCTHALLILFLAVAPLFCGCNRSTPPNTPEALKGSLAGYNILLLTLDTTRADHLGFAGWERAVTPALDDLAHRGVHFTNAFTQVPITLPSHGTMLTGCYPAEIGLRDNGPDSLAPGLRTLAQILRDQGYRTAAFLASFVLDSRFGLDRGFEVYEDDMVSIASSPRGEEISADLVVDRGLAWLTRVKDQRFMGWLHFYDPHTPYTPPTAYLEKAAGDGYDGEIAFVDAQISRVMEWLSANGLREKTLIIAVGDHGESLGEHRYLWHSLLAYDAMMRVPLIVSLPGRIPEGQVRADTVRLIDLMPTVLELIGQPIPAEVSGESFLPALVGRTLAPRSSYGESDYGFHNFGWSKLRCLVDGNWKYIRAPQIELYDLATDRGELNNIAADHPEIVEDMEAALAALEAAMRQREGASVVMDAEGLARLQSLGYVGGAPAPVETSNLKNPRDMADIDHDFRMAEYHIVNNEGAEAISLLEPAVKRSPESFVLVLGLGKAYRLAGRLVDSQAMLLRAVSMHPESAEANIELAITLGTRGRLAQAAAACQRGMALDEKYPDAKELLTRLATYAQQRHGEMEKCRQQLAADPNSAEAALRLGTLLLTAGDTQAALDVLRPAVAGRPNNRDLARTLAWVLATAWDAELRDGAEALRLARLSCDTAGEPEIESQVALAAAQAETGDYPAATQTAIRAAERAAAADKEALAATIRGYLVYYQAGRPYRELP
ncbi:MAG: sulfatase-like hydrolase/transferase [Phycisphaerae bacterium]